VREPVSLLPLALLALAASAILTATGASTPAAAPAAKSTGVVACNLSLDVVDPDPRGMNVRATPGKPAGRVLATLPLAQEWTEVHVTGQSGDWLRIDRAETVDDEAPEGMREVWKGSGWVHVSGLGVSELSTGEGTVLRAAPADSSPVLLRITPDNEPKHVRVLGCRARWLQVDADRLKGWTRSWCNNQRTTCS
jgi:hypothetical protein